MVNHEHCPACGHLLSAQCGNECYSHLELIAAQDREIGSLRRTIAQLRGAGAGRSIALERADKNDDWLDELTAEMAAVARSVGPTVFEEPTYPRRGYRQAMPPTTAR